MKKRSKYRPRTVMNIERAHDAVQKVVAQGRARAVVQAQKEPV